MNKNGVLNFFVQGASGECISDGSVRYCLYGNIAFWNSQGNESLSRKRQTSIRQISRNKD